MRKWKFLLNTGLINAKQMLPYCCFLSNSSNTYAHYLLTKIILCNFISLQAFTVYMEYLLQLEISIWSNWLKWNLYQNEFHFAWTNKNTNHEVTLYQVEILPWSEISNWFEFTLGLM